MTYLPEGVVHVSFAGGGIVLPDRSTSDRQNVIEEVEARVRAKGLVQVLVEDRRWLVHCPQGPCAADCCRCKLALKIACYAPADTPAAAMCLACVLSRGTTGTPSKARTLRDEEEAEQ